MSTKPSQNGQYRIKLSGSTQYLALNDKNYVVLQPANASSPAQKWDIKINVSGANTFTATNASNNMNLSYRMNDPNDGDELGISVGSATQATIWKIDEASGYSQIGVSSKQNDGQVWGFVFDAPFDSKIVHFQEKNSALAEQKYLFEAVTSGTGDNTGDNTNTGNNRPPPASGFENAFFPFSVEDTKGNDYDIIVVGTGMGGGVIARDLYETNSRLGDDAKSVLVIEKGPLLFHSHCLNTARPEGLANDRGQQNDTFFARFRQDYKFETADGGNDVYGGPMYNLGGRSATWGLFAPRIHENTLARYFPVAVETALKDTYYEKAEKLFNISLPTTKIIHQHLIDRLNAAAESDHGIHWQWGKIASEFKDDKNFDFAEGAYSTIDRLLEIAMSKPLGPPPEKRPQEHINFKMLIRTEVRKLEINSQKTVTGVVVRTEAGVEHTIKLKANGRVILAAGSVNSPAILFRSNISPRADCLLTDHDVIYRSLAFRYLKENYEKLVGAMKLQTYFNLGLGDNRVGLVDMSIDASSYLPRSNTADYSLPQFIMAFIIPCTLEPSCNVNLGSNNEPTVKIVRNTRYSTTERQKYEERMKKVIESATGVIEKHFKVEFIGKDKPFMNNEYFGKLELCAIASELGTLPMPGRGTEASSVDENLKLKGGYEGIYVCDLSVFPMSPEVNPSLTLAALALRLSRHLVPRRRYRATTTTEICVVNSSGRPIKVWVSNLGGAQRKYLQPEVVLPGGRFATERILNVQESVMVYRLSKADESQYSTEPELYIGHPGGGRKGVITIL